MFPLTPALEAQNTVLGSRVGGQQCPFNLTNSSLQPETEWRRRSSWQNCWESPSANARRRLERQPRPHRGQSHAQSSVRHPAPPIARRIRVGVWQSNVTLMLPCRRTAGGWTGGAYPAAVWRIVAPVLPADPAGAAAFVAQAATIARSMEKWFQQSSLTSDSLLQDAAILLSRK
jgi:hypothetical protein